MLQLMRRGREDLDLSSDGSETGSVVGEVLVEDHDREECQLNRKRCNGEL